MFRRNLNIRRRFPSTKSLVPIFSAPEPLFSNSTLTKRRHRNGGGGGNNASKGGKGTGGGSSTGTGTGTGSGTSNVTGASGQAVDASCDQVITPTCLQTLYGIPTTAATNQDNQLGVSGFIEQFANKNDLQVGCIRCT